jgi:hypothetical protein
MPVSNLDPAALARLTPNDLASMALAADQERRRLLKAGDLAAAAAYAEESARLADAFQRA